MRTKRTAKNQITLPTSVVTELGNPEHFEIALEDGRIVLTPAPSEAGDAVRRKLAELDINESDIHDAVNWARQGE